jgi:hypothetical protein
MEDEPAGQNQHENRPLKTGRVARPVTPESLIHALRSVEVVSVPLHVSGRAKPHSMMYFRMCCEAVEEFRHLRAAMADSFLLDPTHLEKRERLEMASVKPIVFAGMCLEATLFDLSACLFGNDFAESIDRLNPLGKFLVIAQCVDREAPSSSHVAHQYIDALVKARNLLVHYKSDEMVDAKLDKLLEREQEGQASKPETVTKSFKALVLLSLYFDGNIFEELRILPSFKKPDYWKELIPRSLHADVHECIAAHKRASRKRQGDGRDRS